MTVIYQTTITRIGASAIDALSDQMLITFREGAPADLEEYCFIHCHGELKGALHPGLQFSLGQHRYPVTAVGSVAEDNLRELGHVTLRFDGLNEAEFPVWLPRGIASRLSIFRATKPQMWHKKLTPNMVKVWRTVLVLTPLASKAFWRSLVG